MAKKTSPWVKHVTSTYKEMKKRNKNATLGDAMKAAKKTYKKNKGGGSPPEIMGGGSPPEIMGGDSHPEIMGGKRRTNKSKKRRTNKRKSRKNRTRKSRR